MANYSAYGGPLNFTRDNVSYPHNYSWLAEGGPLKKVSDSQVMDDNTLYTKLPDEYDSDPSIKYHAYLPNVTVYGEKPRRESANKPMEGLPFLNAATLGLANNLSMSHNLYSNEGSFPYIIDKLRGNYPNFNQYDYEKDFPYIIK